MGRVLALCLFVVAVVVPTTGGAATQLTFAPSADVYVSSSNPTTNYGSRTSVEADGSPLERTLFRFDVSGVGAGVLTSAKLRLFNVNDSGAGGSFYRLQPTPAWTEGSVTWNTAPSVTGSTVATLGSVSTSGWYEVELKAIINGDGTFEVGMNSTNSNGVGYASKEASSANRPQLIVTFDAPPPDPGIPSVSITSPAAGSTVSGTVSVQASASDDVGVAQVDFFVDGTLAGTDVLPPFSFDWNTTTVPDGSHSLSAKAYDGDGKTGSSAAVPVTVKNSTDPITLTIFPSADVYVRSDNASSNYGTATSFEADASPVERTLFRFQVAGVGTGLIASAKLRMLNTNASNAGGSFYRLASTPAWTETGVNWNTAPAVSGSAVASIGAASQGTWYEAELKSIITGDGAFEFGMSSASSDGVGYASREASAANRPRLIVTFTPKPVDPTVPAVAITAPTAGSTVSGTVSVQASATDDVAVQSVQFFVDGTLIGTDVESPFAADWDTNTVADGPHDLTAKAFDGDGKSAMSEPVRVTVRNFVDTSPPTAPPGLVATAAGSTRINLTWSAASDNVGVTQYDVFRDGSLITWTASTSYGDTGVSGGRRYAYFVKARDAAGNTSGQSNTAEATTPASSTTVSFGVAGDLGANSSTAKSLNLLDSSGVNFFLAVGDLDYGEVSSPQAWCSYIKSHLPTLGPNFPFELVAGNHEDENIDEHAACLPDRLNARIGPNSFYGAEYYFDYPATNPLVRVLMVSPKLSPLGSSYSYSKGSSHYNWVASSLDDAAAKGIPWTVVGWHMSSPGSDFTNLLVEKKVDLAVYGHTHDYSRGDQLTACSGGSGFNCVNDNGSDGVYPNGGGTVFLLNGSFGQGSPNGFTKVTLSADRLDAQFVGETTDVWSIR